MAREKNSRFRRNITVLIAVAIFCVAGSAVSRNVNSTVLEGPLRAVTNTPPTVGAGKTGKPNSSSSVPANFPGEIAFNQFIGAIRRVSDIGGQNDIDYLTTNNETKPVYSRDGKKILFKSFRDGETGSGVQELYSMDPDGYGQRRLTNGSGFVEEYDLSPVASKVVYISDGDIWTVNADGTGQTEILDRENQLREPQFSPDGTKILFIYDGEIWIMNSDGSSPIDLGIVNSTDRARFSPDGTKIVFSSSDEIYTIDSDGTDEVRIIDNDGNDHNLSDPEYSPDGTKLLMRCYGALGANVCTADADGSDFQPVSAVPSVFLERVSPVWSPASNAVAFVSRAPVTNLFSIAVANIGQAPQTIFETGDYLQDIAWRPDCTATATPTPTPTPTATPTPLPGIISEWNANQSNADDSVGNNHGQFLNGATLVDPGKVGFGFYMPETGGFIEVPDDDTLDVQDGDYTLSTWFYPAGSAQHYVAGKGGCNDQANRFFIGVDSNYVPFLDISHETGGSSTGNPAFALTQYQWHHLLLRKIGNEHRLYVNGQLASQLTIAEPIGVGTQPFTIGKGVYCDSPELQSFGGVDEVRLYGRGLTENEIDELYVGSAFSRKRNDLVCVPHTQPEIAIRANYPNPVAAGRNTTMNVRLDEYAPSGGVEVSVSYSNPGVVFGPATVVVPEGNNMVDFQVTSTMGSGFRSADVTATLGTVTSVATVTVGPAAPEISVSGLAAPPTVSILQNFTASWRVANSGQAATNDYRQDTLFISTDDVLFNSPNDVVVGRKYENGASIPIGAFRDVTFDQVNIPATAIPVDGTYYLFVLVGDAGTVNERGGDFQNNYMSVPITVNRNLPDIIAQNIVAPTEVEPKNTFTVTWEAKNQGSAATTAGFRQDLIYSFDQTVGNSDDVLITQRFDAAMPVGEVRSYGQQYFFNTLPVRPSSDGMFFVKVDAANQVYEDAPGGPAESNNITTFASRFEYRVPDVRVATVTPPTEVESDTTFAVNWTTQNAGNKAAASMSERVYFSTDNVVSGNDTLLGTFTLEQTLAAGESVNRTQNVSIPTNSITATGNYFVYVVTDAFNQIDEGANENNNTTFGGLRVRRLLRPDLQTTNITAPATVFFDQQIQVQWTVSNIGSGPTNAANWQDDVYLGLSQNLNGATRLATLSNVSFLNAGESYIATATVRIPRGSSGSYYIIVKTDKDGLVNEENENNNLTTRPITINIPPLPDIRVSNVQAPETGIGGQPILISWTVTNHGNGSTPSNESTWSDAIYISRDNVLGGDDRFVVARPRSGVMAPNGTYTVSDYSVVLPGDAFGNYFVFVQTDAYDQLYEFTANGNNSDYDATAPGSPMNVLGTPPDLTVLSPITAPANEQAGRQINVQFTVRNQGAFDANGGWWDTVYISSDTVFDPINDTPIGSAVQNGLTAGNQYGRSITATLPGCLNGTYYLFAVTDSQGQIFEYDVKGNAEANNVSAAKQIEISSFSPDLQVTNITIPPVVINGAMPISWTVKNFGTAATLQNGWSDQILLIQNGQVRNLGIFERIGGLAINGEYTQNRIVYIPLFLEGDVQIVVRADVFNSVPECSYELNNESSGNTNAQQDLPDLRINSVNSPSAASLGQMFNVSWTGSNDSAAMSNSASWSDTVYLSTNTTFEPGDTLIGGSIRNGQLASGQTYGGNANVTIPNIAPGNYYLFVNADSGGHVSEGINENNNVSSPIAINISAPQVDLQVTSVTADPVIYSGQFTNISWTVTNLGSLQTLSNSWIDHVILSRDNILDPTDIVLDSRVHSGAVSGGANYSETRSITIPSGLSGEYKIFVATDRGNQVVESIETNNISAPRIVELQLPPPAELNITNISPPATASIGEEATFNWTVQNSSANVVNGVWQDSLYLSTDNTWDSGDALIAQKQRSGTVGAFATYTESYAVTVPPVELGTYYLIVRTDARNSVRESNETNNVSSSVGQLTVGVPNLMLGVPLNTVLSSGQEKYYSITGVPLDETMLITLDGEEGSRNELYTRSESMVSRANFELQGERRGFADQENTVRNTEADTYFTMARADFVPASFADELKKNDVRKRDAVLAEQAVIMKAEILPFSIRSVSPAVAGNRGLATVVVEGAKFKPGATLRLIGQNNLELAPVDADNSTSRFAAIFDLKGKPAGYYNVVVRNPDAQVATLSNGFRIINGGGYSLRSGIVGETEVRPRTTRYIFSASNEGSNDALNVPILISFPRNIGYTLDLRNFREFPQSELPTGTPTNGVPMFTDVGDIRTLMLYAPILRSNSTIEVAVDLAIPNGFNAFKVAIQVMPPLAEWVASDPAANQSLSISTYGRSSSMVGPDPQRDCWTEVARQAIFFILGELLPGDCLAAGWNVLLSSADVVTNLMLKGGGASGFDQVNALAGKIMSTLGKLATECGGQVIPWFKAASTAVAIFQLIAQIYDCLQNLKSELTVRPSRSIDPNEKLGPEGFGPERWVAKDKPLLYRINFENLPTATAPAQRIRVIDQLPATLDPRTLRLLEIGFKQYRIEVPANRAFYQNRLQLGADLNNLKADISAGLDITTGRVTWTLTAIDPNTNERPLSPLLGLLPPNNEQRDGEGYVIFSVAPKTNLLTRTDLANSAEIYFDENDPIITNATTNLVDADLPTSQLSSLPATTGDPSIPLSWSGTDDSNGSGLKSFDIFAAENGGAFLPVVTGSTENGIVFNGKYGRSYRFYSVAQDNAGNIESAPVQHDAEIIVLGGAYEADVASRPNGNNDGTVNAQDVDQVRRFVAKLDTDYQYNEFQRADTAPLADAGNGELSVADVVQANRYAGGQDAVRFNAGPLTAGTLSESNTKAGKGAGLLPRAITPRTLFRQGNTIKMEINLESQGDETGAGFTLNFNTAHLSNPRNFTVGSGIVGGSVLANTAAPGQIGIVVDRSPTLPIAAGTRQLLTLEFDVAPTAPTQTSITFSSDIVKNEIVDPLANRLTTAFDPATIFLLAPTSSNVSVSGRVVSSSGKAVRDTIVFLTDDSGFVRRTVNDSAGRFRFDNVTVGRTYTITVRNKSFRFEQPTRVISVTDEISDIEFVTLE